MDFVAIYIGSISPAVYKSPTIQALELGGPELRGKGIHFAAVPATFLEIVLIAVFFAFPEVVDGDESIFFEGI